MENVALGQSSIQISRLGYGCWRILGPENCEVTSDRKSAARRAILAAYESGYTFFDHADIYAGGEAEAVFGEALREMPSMRERIVLASKCGIRKAGEPSAEAPYRYDFSAEHIIRACEGSLKRLGVDGVDIYMLHRPDYLMEPDEVARALAQLRQSGKAREFGLSNFRPAQVGLLQKSLGFPLQAHQVEISLMQLSRFEDGTLEQCQLERLTPLAWSPLAGGRLGAHDPIDLRQPDHAHRLRLRETLDLVARAHSAPRAVIAIAWLLKHPAGIVPIIGSTDPARIRELAQSTKLDLTREEWYRILEAALGARLP